MNDVIVVIMRNLLLYPAQTNTTTLQLGNGLSTFI